MNHFRTFLNATRPNRSHGKWDVMQAGPILNAEQAQLLIRPVSGEEIRAAIFDIDGNKSPGPDGFGSAFYKAAWPTIGGEVIEVVQEFFRARKLLEQVNATVISLIPKVNTPTLASDFRPIACCNVLYKVISKVLCTRLRGILPHLIHKNQCAFVEGRSIVHNILIGEDLIRCYNRKSASARCLIKLDLRKAYDTIEWAFVREVMLGLGFPLLFVEWIMECLTTVRFSINVNGTLHGYFGTSRGLRQGDPISPMLFVLVMDYLSHLLKVMGLDRSFAFHPGCKDLKLNHLMFADDVLLFCKGDLKSIKCLMVALTHFADVSGLEVNKNKTHLMSAGVSEEVKGQIVIPQKIGNLLFMHGPFMKCSSTNASR